MLVEENRSDDNNNEGRDVSVHINEDLMEGELEDSDATKHGKNEFGNDEDKYEEGNENIDQQYINQVEDKASAEEESNLFVSGRNDVFESREFVGGMNLPYGTIVQVYHDKDADKVTTKLQDTTHEAYSLHQKGQRERLAEVMTSLYNEGNSLTGMDAYMRPFFDELH